MTKIELFKHIEQHLETKFDTRETLNLLQSYGIKFWSWGAHDYCNLQDRGLLFKVQGHHHKGWVLITLNWTDTYTIKLFKQNGVEVYSLNMVYNEDLFNILDEKIEKIPEYVH